VRISQLPRRHFFQLWAVLGLQGFFRPPVEICAACPGPVIPDSLALSPVQVATLRAIAEQLIPRDQDPGAQEAGVIDYISKLLGDEQADKLPLYVGGLIGTDETSLLMFSRSFVQLTATEQENVLKAIESGRAEGTTWQTIPSETFFATVWNHVLESFYGTPAHGGNKNYASWKMMGFPEHSGAM